MPPDSTTEALVPRSSGNKVTSPARHSFWPEAATGTVRQMLAKPTLPEAASKLWIEMRSASAGTSKATSVWRFASGMRTVGAQSSIARPVGATLRRSRRLSVGS